MHLFALYTGTGAIILTFYLDKQNEKNSYIKLFILFTLIFSLFEYLVGFVLDALFAERWWDYSDNKFNLNGRVTVLNSFFWGVITVVFAKFLYPLILKFKEKVIYKIPSDIQILISVLLMYTLFFDFLMSCVKYL